MTESRSFVCPDCKHKKVFFRFGRNGEDYYECKRCHWAAYANPEHWDVSGKLDIQHLQELNPDKQF